MGNTTTRKTKTKVTTTELPSDWEEGLIRVGLLLAGLGTGALGMWIWAAAQLATRPYCGGW